MSLSYCKGGHLRFLPDIPVTKLQHTLVTSTYCLPRAYLELGCPYGILKEESLSKPGQVICIFPELTGE